MQQQFADAKQHYAAHRNPSREQRDRDLAKLAEVLLQQQQALVAALTQDYGQRAEFDSLFTDIVPSLNLIRYSRSNLKKWMKASRRHAGLMLSPSKVEVQYQPKGVVGIIVPWNFPIYLALGPLISAIAAGNVAMLKLSEFTPHTNAVIKQLLADFGHQAQVVEGEAEVAAAFSALPFDHLLFTGSTAVGRHVMRAAADNLTPVTLELGGKSPVLIDDQFDMAEAVARIIYGKCLNAGQICVAPDYVLLPREKIAAFIDAFKAHFQRCYPDGLASKDFSSIVNQRQYQRLQHNLTDAIDKGATVHPVAEHASDDDHHRLLPHLLTNVSDQMQVMNDEIFGPLLPLVPYDSVDEALAYINQRPRPLALYLMSFDKSLQQRVTSETHSGGVSLNDTVVHVAADDAPFGGIGPSGMGHYHGIEGFRTFSHAKTVVHRGRINFTQMLHPPYGNALQRLMLKLLAR
ncbi:coniferyl aldehyde dehydrogenase [Ferrimonas senticii]|uniref:coniferyl aldehyde dehydrogenase n=1 Tax=Ferrimonas senticii TaxID=394566 RepID=UPI0012EBA028